MKAAPLKRAPTFFLKAVVVLIGAAVFALCAFVFPQIYGELSEWKATQYAPAIYAAWIGLFASPIPFYLALCQVFKLLHFIDKNNAFSELSITALRNIKYCAIAISALYGACLPLVFVIAELDDAPGLVLMGAAVAFSPLIVATFAAALQKLVQHAVDLKAEHELTV
jgi:hypothetical protein